MISVEKSSAAGPSSFEPSLPQSTPPKQLSISNSIQRVFKAASSVQAKAPTRLQTPISKALRFPKTVNKARFCFSSIFKWVCSRTPAVWTFGIMRYALLGTPSEFTMKKMDKEVNELSGSQHLAQSIHAAAPILARELQKSLIQSGEYNTFEAFLKREQCTLEMLIEAILPKVYVNIARRIRGESSVRSPIGLAEVVSYLYKLASRHLPTINSQIEALANEEPSKRQKKIGKLFEPLAKEFLTVAFPEGTEGLPLRSLPRLAYSVGKHFGFQVIEKALPKILMNLYIQLTEPLETDSKLFLKERPSGETIVALCEVAGQKCAEGLVTLSQWPEEEPLPPPFIQTLMERANGLFSGSNHLKNWLTAWLGKQLSEIGSKGDVNLKLFRIFIGKYIEPILLHVFCYMSQLPADAVNLKGSIPDAFGIMAIRFFSECSKFFNAQGKLIVERIETLKLSEAHELENDEQLLSLVKEFSKGLLAMAGLDKKENLPVPSFLKGVLHDNLNAQMPNFLLKQILCIYRGNQLKDAHLKLRNILFDPANLLKGEVAKKVVSALHAERNSLQADMAEKFDEKLWEASGTENIAQTLESFCVAIAHEFVEALFSRLGVNAQRALADENNVFMKKTRTYLKGIVEAMLIETTVNVLETTQDTIPTQEGVHPRQFAILNVLLRLSKLVHKGLKNMEQRLQEVAETFSHDKHLQAQEIRKQFLWLAEKLHELGGENIYKHLPLDGMPGGDKLKKMVWGGLKDAILPDLLHACYSNFMGWNRQFNQSLLDLEHCYRTTHPHWACHLIAQYVTDFIKHYLSTSSEDAAKVTLNALRNHFASSKQRGSEVLVSNMLNQSISLEALLSQNARYIERDLDPTMDILWMDLTRYIEGIILKFFSELSKSIHQIEIDNPDFMVDLATTLLKETAEYFKVVNKAVADSEADHGYMLHPSSILSALGPNLHPGVPLDPAADNQVKERIRLEGEFIPLAAKILELSNLTIKDFPVPAALRDQLGELIMQKILPLALMHSTSKGLQNHVRDGLMLNFVQILYSALHRVDLPKEETIEVRARPDPKQQHLNETCGAVILELVKLIPDTTMQYVFMKEKVKNMSAEAIGELMMPHLSRWTLIQLIDQMLYHGLPTLHPSKWEGKVGREKLVPRQAFVTSDGIKELNTANKFSFIFPRTPAQIQADMQAKQVEAKNVRMRLRNAFTCTISAQLRSKAWSFIRTLWNNLQTYLNDFIEHQFPERGLKVKAAMDKLLGGIFFDILGPVIEFILSPFIRMCQYMIEKVYIDKRADDIIENLHSEALEHLFYTWIDSVMDSLLHLRKAKLAKVAS